MSAGIDRFPGMKLVETPYAEGKTGHATAEAASPVDELASRIVSGAGQLAAASCAWLLLVADFDAADGTYRFGLASTAQWLTHTCGVAARTAGEHVRVARALAGFPRLAAAMSAGKLSYSRCGRSPGSLSLVNTGWSRSWSRWSGSARSPNWR
jgi:hypothetical protein